MLNASMNQAKANGFTLLLQQRKAAQEKPAQSPLQRVMEQTAPAAQQAPVVVPFAPVQHDAARALKAVERNHRSFRLIVSLSQAIRTVKSALAVLDFEHIQLGERRLMCLKKVNANGERVCLEFSFETLPSGLIEISLFNCNRNLDSIHTELLRRQINKLQQLIERAA